VLALCLPLAACPPAGDDDDSSPGDEILLPGVAGVGWVAEIDHPLLPYRPGNTWHYEAETEDGLETIDIEVLAETRSIQDAVATIVRDTVRVDGELAEDTWDWYAQDDEGNVWYLGEDTCEYDDGECADTGGAWEWGSDGALPGIQMWADPATGTGRYYQEYYPGEAEDWGEVVGTGLEVEVEAGSFGSCVQIHEGSALDPDASGDKFYCPGVGVAKEEEHDATVELITHSVE
jgi:hypothetical protein